MDKIIIKNAKLMVNVGVTKEEKAEKQEILVDVEIFFDLPSSDSIEDTINYSTVYKEIKQLVENKEYNLIETIAQDIADVIKVERFKVVVKKPNAIKDAEYAAVEITR